MTSVAALFYNPPGASTLFPLSCINMLPFITDTHLPIENEKKEKTNTRGSFGSKESCCTDAPCMMLHVYVCVLSRARGRRAAFSRDAGAKGIGGRGVHFGQDFFVAQRTDHGFLEQCS